jgi:hypothetical protein
MTSEKRLVRIPGITTGELPVRKDFVEDERDLDADQAWKNFGGLSLDQAYERFCQRPEIYQEDFMFMGPRAFQYYFPVIEQYLKETKTEDEFEDCEAWIIAKAIESKIDTGELSLATGFTDRLIELCRYVQKNVEPYSLQKKERDRIEGAWQKLRKKLERIG